MLFPRTFFTSKKRETNLYNLFFVFYFFGSIYVRSQCLYVVQRATLTWIIPAVKLYISSFGFDVVVVLLLFTAAVVSCPKMRNRIMTITLFFSIIILNYIVVSQMNANKSIIFKINSFLIFHQISKRLILC